MGTAVVTATNEDGATEVATDEEDAAGAATDTKGATYVATEEGDATGVASDKTGVSFVITGGACTLWAGTLWATTEGTGTPGVIAEDVATVVGTDDVSTSTSESSIERTGTSSTSGKFDNAGKSSYLNLLIN